MAKNAPKGNGKSAIENDEVVKAKLGFKGTLIVAVIAALGAAGGSWISGVKLVESARVTAQINGRTACFAGADSRLSNFQSKSSAFISSVAAFRSNLALMNSPNKNMLRDFAVSVSQNGYGLTPYLTPRLFSLSRDMSDAVRSISEDPQYASSKDLKIIDSSLDSWLPASTEYLKEIDKQKNECKAKYPI